MRRLSPNIVVAVAHFHTAVVAACLIDVDQVHDDDRVAVANVRILLLVRSTSALPSFLATL
jgi:hypothetical protein